MIGSNKKYLIKNSKQYISEIFSYLNIKSEDIDLINTGTTSLIVKFRQGTKYYCLKIPSDKVIIPEIFFLQKAKENHIKVPEIISYDINSKVIPFPFIIVEWIDNSQSFTGHITDGVAVSAGSVYAEEIYKLHQIKVNGFGYPLDIKGNKWDSETWVDALKLFIDRNIDNQIPKLLFNNSQLEGIYNATIRNNKLNLDQPNLIHGDIPNGLMKWHPKIEFLGFIDPSGIVGGNYMFDVASIYNINENGDLGEGFMSGFEGKYRDLHKFDADTEYSFKCHRLFHIFWRSCYFYQNKWNHESLVQLTIKSLNEIV